MSVIPYRGSKKSDNKQMRRTAYGRCYKSGGACNGRNNSTLRWRQSNPIFFIQQINSNESNLKKRVHFLVNKIVLWHLRLGHTNLDRIHRLVTSGHLGSLDVTALAVCEPYLEGKMTMRTFNARIKGQRGIGFSSHRIFASL